jgi:hypothetical protein
MSAGDILDQAIRIYRQNFVPLIIMVAIVVLPVTILQTAALALIFPFSTLLTDPTQFDPNTFDPDTFETSTLFGPFIVLTIVFSILSAIVTLFQWGAITSFVSERFLGRTITVRQAYGNAFRRGLSLFIAAILFFGAILVIYLALVAAFIVPFAMVAALGSSGGDGPAAAVGFAFLCLCVLFIPVLFGIAFLLTRWAFWVQAIMCEGFNSTGSLGRSWKLTKGSALRVFAFLLLLGILIYAVSAGLAFTVTFGTIFIGSPLLQLLAQSAIGAIIGIVVAPLQAAVLTVLYYDLRIRKEGFDLQMQMQEGTTATDLPSLIPGA